MCLCLCVHMCYVLVLFYMRVVCGCVRVYFCLMCSCVGTCLCLCLFPSCLSTCACVCVCLCVRMCVCLHGFVSACLRECVRVSVSTCVLRVCYSTRPKQHPVPVDMAVAFDSPLKSASHSHSSRHFKPAPHPCPPHQCYNHSLPPTLYATHI